jgi:hypothetical protein
MVRKLCSARDNLEFSIRFWAHMISSSVFSCMLFIVSCVAAIVNDYLGMLKAGGLFRDRLICYIYFAGTPLYGIFLNAHFI